MKLGFASGFGRLADAPRVRKLPGPNECAARWPIQAPPLFQQAAQPDAFGRFRIQTHAKRAMASAKVLLGRSPCPTSVWVPATSFRARSVNSFESSLDAQLGRTAQLLSKLIA
jgi:hypothetical protein